MIGFDTKDGERGRPYWGNYWRAMMSPHPQLTDTKEIHYYLNKCLEQYSATLVLETIADYWIVSFEHEKDYFYFMMEWS